MKNNDRRRSPSISGSPAGKNAQIPYTNPGLNIIDVLDAIPFYVMLVDEDHNIIEANVAVQSQLGVRREDIIGCYCPQAIHGIKEPFPGCPLEEAALKDQPVERELFDSGTGRWLRSAIYPTRVLTRDGKKIFVHLVADITERKLADDQLKISHQQLRKLSARLETVREEEKKRIARDLHDETSQVVTSLIARLQTAIETLPEGADKSEEILQKAQTLTTMVLDQLHSIIYELRPSLLDSLGLVTALNSLADNRLKEAGIKLSFKKSGREKRLSPAIEIGVYRIVQEIINNIIKHARARNVVIGLNFRRDNVIIRVKDDGVGFNVQKDVYANDRPHGLGLVGIKERIEQMNGSLTVRSTLGHGTHVIVQVPLS